LYGARRRKANSEEVVGQFELRLPRLRRPSPSTGRTIEKKEKRALAEGVDFADCGGSSTPELIA
jgi:hypothetical protein